MVMVLVLRRTTLLCYSTLPYFYFTYNITDIKYHAANV